MLDTDSAVEHAVIPAAGLGTRFLPFTKAVPKELLPLGSRACIDYTVSEAAGAGITDVLLITREGKEAILRYFRPDPQLEAATAGTAPGRALRALRERTAGVDISEIYQENPAGLGDAIAQAAPHVGNNPFAVLLPDDLVPENEDLLARMVAVRSRLGGSVIAVFEVSPEEATAYGSIAYEEVEGFDGVVVKVTNLVEKPAVGEALSQYAVAGRYVLDPAVFEVLRTLPPGRGGEVQVTDALAVLASMDTAAGGGLHAVVYSGARYDTGTPSGYLQASLEVALTDPSTAEATESLIQEVLSSQMGD